jgi:hypothetical protein
MIKRILKALSNNPAMALLPLLIFANSAQALPSFSRQTGEACTACHVQTWGANLTPRGREFKLKGYTEGEGKWIPPLSVVAEGGGFFNLDDKRYARDFLDRPILLPQDRSYFAGSVFYAGKIAGPVGAYVEGSYAHDPESGAGTGFLNKVDLRFANQVKVAGHQVDYGISVNNEPGVQDLWNTNAVWSSSSLVFANSSSTFTPTPLADRKLSGNVAGASLYALINKLLYVEAGGYASLPKDVQQGIGRNNFDMYLNMNPVIDGAASYWRIALQHEWDGHYFSIGHFGLQADADFVNPYFDVFLGHTFVVPLAAQTSDLGLDATYQYLANPEHIFEFKGRYIRETQSNFHPYSGHARLQFRPSEATTESFNINGVYTWSQTVGLAVGYSQYVWPTLMSAGTMDFNYLTTELSYTPFGNQNSLASPWANLRLSLAYVAAVSKQPITVPQDSLYLSGRLAF